MANETHRYLVFIVEAGHRRMIARGVSRTVASQRVNELRSRGIDAIAQNESRPSRGNCYTTLRKS